MGHTSGRRAARFFLCSNRLWQSNTKMKTTCLTLWTTYSIVSRRCPPNKECRFSSRVEGKMSRVEGRMSRGEGNMSRVEGSMSRVQKCRPDLPSTSVKYFPPWSSALPSSIVFVWYWFLLMLLLRSYGSRHSRIDPSGLETGTTLLIQSVSPWTASMIPELHNPSSSSLYAAFFFSGTARGGCCTGCASGLSWIWYLPPGSFPIPSNKSQNSDNTYSFVMGKLCLFSFRMTASSNTSHVDLLTGIWSQDVNTCMDLRRTG